MSQGTLYLVATPIGNLDDCTPRAVKVLQEVDLVAAEDTRHSRKLLQHFGVSTRLISYHDHNEEERSRELVARLQEGESIALISDAGTPGISDPGYRIVRACREAGVPVYPVPGVSAAVTALCVSGLPTDAFLFAGFLPAKEGKRNEAFARYARMVETLVFYESPHRIVTTLEEMIPHFRGERPIFLARELTKLHEEHFFGTLEGVLAQLKAREQVKGELVLVVGGAVEQPAEQGDLPEEVRRALAAGEYRPKELAKLLAGRFGLQVADVYAEILKQKEGV